MTATEYVKSLLIKTGKKTPESNGVDLFHLGILDSLSVARLIADIEAEYGFEFDIDDIVPEKFSTINDISKLIDIYVQRRGTNGN